jgi:two-component system sensor histidine kinase PilS (NtrC family)
MRTVDLVGLLDDTLTLLEHLPDRRIRIERNFAVEHAYTMGDADKLKQVFWNVCSNGLRAIQQRLSDGLSSGVLTVELRASERNWTLGFCDNGPGIPSQQMESMFEPFQSNFEGGTGLGLALVYQILQAHQAKILVRSELGAGAEFVLSFLRAEEPVGAVPAMLAAEKV